MRIEQADSVTDELVQAWRRLAPQLSPDAPVPDRAQLQRVVGSSNAALLVARDEGGEVMGSLTVAWYPIPTGTRAWIEDVVVDGAARGRGVGEALVRAALDHARSLGATTVELTSRPEREAANRLYQRMGFRHRETNAYRYRFDEPT